jgi:hypothetical protein
MGKFQQFVEKLPLMAEGAWGRDKEGVFSF